MHFILAALAAAFVVAGFVGFAAGGIPTIVFWILAAVCLLGSWKTRPAGQRVRGHRSMHDAPPH